MDSDGDGIGDLGGITARLDYLSWLGIGVIWLCPIFRSPNDDNGYDISDYQDIMAEFGTMADFDRLLAEAHRRGMRVILDLVLNHTSDEHPWFIESRSSRDDPRRDWYIWRNGRRGREPNNWASIFEGSAWTLDPATGQYYLHLFSARQPDLDWENPALRRAMYDMVRWWLDKGIDGFRIDAISHLKKAPGLPDLPNPHRLRYVPSYPMHMNRPGVLDFVDELSRETFRHYDIMTVGEANGVSPDEAVEWVGAARRRLSMILQFEHWTLWSRDPHAELDVVAVKRIFTRWQRALHGRGWNALYLENHDLPRVLSRWGDPRHHRFASATALATMYFLMEGTPFIYQGQELGMANTVFHSLAEFDDVFARNRIAQMRAEGRDDDHILAELALTARDNSRTPMPWSDGDNAGFSPATPWLPVNPEYREVNVARQRGAADSVLHFYRRLIALRAAEPALIHGRYALLLERNRQIYAYTRTLDGRGFLILCNLTRREAHYRHHRLPLRHDALVLANHEVPAHPAITRCVLRPFEARVYRIDAA
ncbi:glycoside hydrolase family 13 protein [Thauera sinica]|uniref:Alpha-amylase n=1 Tax=Thauera sinica TaxID=2665146 RepID=A0ABW1AWS2_9RHOO|nr:alpha-glucosidase [Thauera sp. K11]